MLPVIGFSLVLFFSACKSDVKSSITNSTTQENIIAKKETRNNVKEPTIVDNSNAEKNPKEREEILNNNNNNNSSKQTDTEEEIKADIQYQKTIKEQIINSEVAKKFDTDCDAIFAKYKATIEKYLKTQEDQVLDEILEWSNDPVFLSCQSQEAYKTKFAEVNSLIE